MPPTPAISVIVPIYNTASYLRQCLESILDQTYRGLEVVCLNDGSTDESLDIMRTFEERDARVRVIDKPNEGYGATCNRGIDAARGTWISIVEPDDWIERGMYADMLAFAERFEAGASPTPLDIVKTPYWRITDPDTPAQRTLSCSYRHRVKPARQPFAVAEAPHLLAHHPSIWSALYRTAFLRERGIRFREIPGAGWADNPFLVETLCQTDRIGYLDQAFYCYREETPEKFAASTRANPTLALERWQDMADVLDRLGVADEGVWRAQVERGFTYLAGIVDVVGWDAPGLRPAAERMFARMDPALVFASAAVAPGLKQAFAEARGVDVPAGAAGRGAYLRDLVGKGLYSIRNNGLGFAFRELAARFGRS